MSGKAGPGVGNRFFPKKRNFFKKKKNCSWHCQFSAIKVNCCSSAFCYVKCLGAILAAVLAFVCENLDHKDVIEQIQEWQRGYCCRKQGLRSTVSGEVQNQSKEWRNGEGRYQYWGTGCIVRYGMGRDFVTSPVWKGERGRSKRRFGKNFW